MFQAKERDNHAKTFIVVAFLKFAKEILFPYNFLVLRLYYLSNAVTN